MLQILFYLALETLSFIPGSCFWV